MPRTPSRVSVVRGTPLLCCFEVMFVECEEWGLSEDLKRMSTASVEAEMPVGAALLLNIAWKSVFQKDRKVQKVVRKLVL